MDNITDNKEANAPTAYGKYVDECLNEATKHFFSEGEDSYSVADLFYAGVRCGESLSEKQDEKTNPYSGISFEYNNHIWGMCARDNGVDILLDKQLFKHLEKQGEHKSAKNIVETWKDMRLEVYQQASGNRHEPNYSDNTTKMFSINDIDEIIEKMSEQILANSAKTCKDAWSELDDYNLQCMIAKVVRDIHNGNVGRNQELIDWLKSLKNRIQSRQNACDKEKISN